MKKLPIILTLVAALFVVSGCTIQYYDDPNAYRDNYDDSYDDEYVDQTDVVFEEFDDLKFWGQWVDLYPYGWVWAPTVVLGWRPYDNGHWIWTEYGWTWASYEPFGWAVYHYGFWAYDIVWGWVWIPDYEWSPARVEWVCYDDYIAWAPLPPPGFRIGEPWNVKKVYPWHVVNDDDFNRPDIGHYNVRYKENYRVRTRSTVKYKAPTVETVERMTNTAVRPVRVSLRDKIQRDGVTIKQINYPDNEEQRIDRYRERVEQKIRDNNPPERHEPVRDDRIIAPRKDRDQREPQKPRQREEPAKKKGGHDKPVKQEPNREPEKKQPEKRQPEKKPEKKQPEKKQPEKKDDGGKDRGERQPKKKRG